MTFVSKLSLNYEFFLYILSSNLTEIRHGNSPVPLECINTLILHNPKY